MMAKAPWKCLLAGVIAVVVACAATVYFWQRPAPTPTPTPSAPLPALTTSPFVNTRKGVAYVGDAACAKCHPDETKAYRAHPMGRSLFTAAEAPPLEQYQDASNPFRVGSLRFQVARKGDRVIHKEWLEDKKGNVVAQAEVPMDFAIGSGTQARSYLFLRDGFLFESPITWYSKKKEWALSPGYDSHLVHFSRGIQPRCAHCHSQQANADEQALNRYEDPPFGQLAIGCERCHGPGETHVASRKKGLPESEIDDTIVNPRHLAPALRENVCEQCHLQGEATIPRRGRSQADYRPGLPLDEYVSIFVDPQADVKKIVSHFDQMRQSACFRQSDGKFGCNSCHDAHGQPDEKEKLSFYQRRCAACHAEKPAQRGVKAPECSAPLPDRLTGGVDDCLRCHMPRSSSSNVAHLAVTDHRVLRDRDNLPKQATKFRIGDLPLVSYHRGKVDLPEDELSRDLALALITAAENAEMRGDRRTSDYLFGHVLPLLDRAVKRAPDDVAALAGRGRALWGLDRPAEGLKSLDEALAQAPRQEQALKWAAEAAETLEQFERAEEYGQRLIRVNPQTARYYALLASIRIGRQDFDSAFEAVRASLRLDPFLTWARGLLGRIYLEKGDVPRARAELEIIGLLDPSFQAKVRDHLARRFPQIK